MPLCRNIPNFSLDGGITIACIRLYVYYLEESNAQKKTTDSIQRGVGKYECFVTQRGP